MRPPFNRLFLALAAVALMALAPLACGSDSTPTPAPKPKVTVWLFRNFVQPGNDLLEKQVRDWAAKNNVDVTLDWTGFADHRTRMAQAVASGNPPDIAEVDPTGPIRFNANLVDISDLEQEVARANGGLLPNVEAYIKHEGRYYGVPHYALQTVLFVRKDLMDAKKLQMPKTWQDVVDVSKAVQDPANKLYGFGQTVKPSIDGQLFMNSLLWEYGGGVFDAQGNAALDSDKNRQALQFAADLVAKSGVVPPDVMTWDDSGNNNSYLNGQSAATVNGGSLYYALQTSQDPKAKEILKSTVLAPPPSGPAGLATMANPYSFVVFKQTKNVALAKDLIRTIEQKQNYSDYLRAEAGQTAPVYENHFKDPFWDTDPNLRAFHQEVRNAKPLGYPGPVSVVAVEVEGRNLLTELATSVVTGAATVDQALKSGQATVQSITGKR